MGTYSHPPCKNQDHGRTLVQVNGKDYFLDLLFYHTRLKCYVVIELKAGEFMSEYIGKLNYYLSAVDDQVRTSDDQPTIGLILCKSKDKLDVEYALRDIHKPMGVSSYITQERAEPKRELRWIDRVVPDGTWSGNLFDFYQKVIKKLTADLKVPFALNGPTRIDETPVHAALREALTNTLIHADYTGRVSVLVVKRPDMFGFRNPGMMRIGVEQAVTGGISDCRNHRLQDMFRYIGLGDHAGSGVPSILKSWKSQQWRAPLLYEDPEYEQTLLELRTSSLIPEESIGELKTLFGDRFGALSELARLILATAITEGRVTHGRLKGLTTEHPKDITAELAHLVRDGFLEKEGETRASVYFIPGSRGTGFALALDFITAPGTSPNLPTFDSPDLTGSSPDLTGSSPDLSEVLIDALKDLGYNRMPGKMDSSRLHSLVRILCTGRWLSARQLAEVLKRDVKNLKIQHLSPMIATKELEYMFAETEKHPGQAYRTSEARE